MNIPSCILKASMQALGKEKIVFIYSSLISILFTVLIYIFVCIFSYGLNSIYIGLMFNYLILSVLLFKEFIITKEDLIYNYNNL